MGKGYLIDTNTLIYFLKASLPQKGYAFLNTVLNSQPIISVITQIELLAYPSISIEEEQFATEIINASSVISLNASIVNNTISIRKQYRIKIPDAIIAATALSNNFSLITSNQKDFATIQGLNIIDPFDL